MIREKIILLHIKDKHVLDIGSVGQTEAYNLWNLYQSVPIKTLVGIDLPDSHETRKKVFSLDDTSNDPQIVYGDMETHKFNRTFDVIVVGDVIEHVNNQGLFLRNIHDHLSNDGELILTTPNAKWWTVFFKPNPTHTLWHDRYTLQRILAMNGFKISLLKYYYGNKKNYNLLFRLLTLRQSILLIAKKS